MLKIVLPSEVKDCWGNIRPELLKMGETDGWIPEDVYAFLIGGHATLYVNDGAWQGFVILQLLPNYSEKRLHIWIAAGWGDMLSYRDEVVEIAKQSGAKRITFESPRRAWEKAGPKYGFEPKRTIYEMVL